MEPEFECNLCGTAFEKSDFLEGVAKCCECGHENHLHKPCCKCPDCNDQPILGEG